MSFAQRIEKTIICPGFRAFCRIAGVAPDRCQAAAFLAGKGAAFAAMRRAPGGVIERGA